jgi:hypothetical protein
MRPFALPVEPYSDTLFHGQGPMDVFLLTLGSRIQHHRPIQEDSFSPREAGHFPDVSAASVWHYYKSSGTPDSKAVLRTRNQVGRTG